MKLNKKIVSLFSLAGLFALAGFVFADQVSLTNYGPSSFPSMINGIVSLFAGLVGGVATIMFVLAGIFYVTSGGQAGQIQKAKTTLFYAIGGIVISLTISSIISFIVGAVS